MAPPRSFARLAGVAWLLLLAAYVVQEWLEGLFAAGHPSGFDGVFGHGGWWAVPLSALAALAVAALLRLAAAVVRAVAPDSRTRFPRPGARTAAAARRDRAVHLSARPPLCRPGASGNGALLARLRSRS